MELKFAMCSQVFTSILRLNQMNATHILTAISLQSAVFKGPVIVLVLAVPNVEWCSVGCSCTRTYQQTSCNTDCSDITRWSYACAYHVGIGQSEAILLYTFFFAVALRPRLLYTYLFLTLRWLMSYIYGAPILDVSRSHTTTQHSR
jgi:hypothetical protein